MNPYYLKVEIQDDELEQVMAELEKAQKMIDACSMKLRFLGVKIVQNKENFVPTDASEEEETASGN